MFTYSVYQNTLESVSNILFMLQKSEDDQVNIVLDLFHRAIIQSGAATCPWTIHENQSSNAAAVAELLGCPIAPPEQLVRCLQEKPIEQVVNASTLSFVSVGLKLKKVSMVRGLQRRIDCHACIV